jgi:8-amino-7-oxononanoate synthase
MAEPTRPPAALRGEVSTPASTRPATSEAPASSAGASPGAGHPWTAAVDERSRIIRAQGRWRAPRRFDPAPANDGSGWLADDGRRVVDFASNDYLGLARHPQVVASACEATEQLGTGSGASRLVSGSRSLHHRLEAALAGWKHTEAAVVFPTGFAANLGVLATFGERGVLLCSDELNHASIVDGARLARAEVAVYRHGDVDHLDRVASGWPGRVLVVSDLVFSMDGDLAPVAELAGWCRRRQALLVLDEAHAVLGPDVGPLLQEVEAIRVGTLSKTLGALGGFAATSRRFAELLVNQARPYIFTTAPTPASAAAAVAALDIVTSAEGDQLRARLSSHIEQVAPGHPTPIVPVVLGAEAAAVAASEQLLAEGIWVPAIRPPTVPAGTARLRVTLSAAHRAADLQRLAAALAALRPAEAGR